MDTHYERENEHLSLERIMTSESAGETTIPVALMTRSRVNMTPTKHAWVIGTTVSQRYDYTGTNTTTRMWTRRNAQRHNKKRHCLGIKHGDQPKQTSDESTGTNPETRKTSTARNSHPKMQSLTCFAPSGGRTSLHDFT